MEAGQAYYKGQLQVEHRPGKQSIYKEMVLLSIAFFCNLVWALILITNREFYGDWHVDSVASSLKRNTIKCTP